MNKLIRSVLGIALSFIMLAGNSPVSASVNLSLIDSAYADTDTVGTARRISYGWTYRVELDENIDGKWFVFTPDHDDAYGFYTDKISGRTPRIEIYDSSLELLAWGEHLSNAPALQRGLKAGETYYIWVTTSKDGAAEYEVTLGEGMAPYVIIDGVKEYTTTGYVDEATLNSHDIIYGFDAPDRCTYTWYRVDEATTREILIEGATANQFRVSNPSDKIRCVVFNNSQWRYTFDIVLNEHEININCDLLNSLSDPNVPGSVRFPGVSGTIYNVYAYACPYYCYDHDIGRSGSASGGDDIFVPGFTRTTVDTFKVTDDYEATDIIPLVAFVNDPQTAGSISAGESQHIALRNHFADNQDDPYWYYYYATDLECYNSDCRVLTFVPQVSGTYQIASSNIVAGDPYLAIFDADYNWLGYSDNYDGSSFVSQIEDFVYGLSGPRFVSDIPTDLSDEDHNFNDVREYEEGHTYYIVCWSSQPDANFIDGTEVSAVVGDYTVTVTRMIPGAGPEGSADTSSSSSSSDGSQTATTPDGTNPGGTNPAGGNTVTTPTPSIPANPNPVQTSERGVAGFVERLYTIALGRASDPAGKQDWVDAITLRGETGASCARGFLFSPEFLNKQCSDEEFVAVLYRTFFDREPDQDGFNAWVGVLRGGTSKEEIIEGFINSTEWANLCLFYGIRSGGTGVPSIEVEPNEQTTGFATRLYTTCLNRNADEAGLMAWARQLSNQRDTGTGAAHGFFFSSEFTNQNVSNGEYVTRLYRTFMNREPDEGGYNAWLAQLDEGVSREDVFNGFAGSIEFARICASYGIVR
ncbi:MAG: DUF4214 domain-containing protein [Clostridiales bacterium]|nr:DUF4214 domain-containing protein [Clostridiales bacterium]